MAPPKIKTPEPVKVPTPKVATPHECPPVEVQANSLSAEALDEVIEKLKSQIDDMKIEIMSEVDGKIVNLEV